MAVALNVLLAYRGEALHGQNFVLATDGAVVIKRLPQGFASAQTTLFLNQPALNESQVLRYAEGKIDELLGGDSRLVVDSYERRRGPSYTAHVSIWGAIANQGGAVLMARSALKSPPFSSKIRAVNHVLDALNNKVIDKEQQYVPPHSTFWNVPLPLLRRPPHWPDNRIYMSFDLPEPRSQSFLNPPGPVSLGVPPPPPPPQQPQPHPAAQHGQDISPQGLSGPSSLGPPRLPPAIQYMQGQGLQQPLVSSSCAVSLPPPAFQHGQDLSLQNPPGSSSFDISSLLPALQNGQDQSSQVPLDPASFNFFPSDPIAQGWQDQSLQDALAQSGLGVPPSSLDWQNQNTQAPLDPAILGGPSPPAPVLEAQETTLQEEPETASPGDLPPAPAAQEEQDIDWANFSVDIPYDLSMFSSNMDFAMPEDPYANIDPNLRQ